MAGFAEELKRIPMSQGLGATLARATDYARAQQHGEVALEHLLLALTEDEDAAQVLAASHVDMALLKADVSLYLGGLSADGDAGHIALAPDLKRILEAAAAAANQGRRREINGAIVLAAIVGDGRSSAAHMLRAQGLTFEEAIKALQRALAATVQPAVAAKPDAEDILATARARVQTRAAPGLPPVAPRPDPIVVPVVPPKAEPVAVIKAEAVAELPAAPPVWPPEVRPSVSPSEQAGDGADFDAIQAEIEAARYREAEESQAASASAAYDRHSDGPSFEQAFEDAPDPNVRDFAEAERYAPLTQAAPQLPMPMPPMLPPMAAIPPPAPSRYAPPQPQSQTASRWPAPVSPAWKDQHGAEQVPLPPPLPPVQPEWDHESQSAQSYESQPGWTDTHPHEQPAGYGEENAQGHGHYEERAEPAFGEHFPPPTPPAMSWPDEAGTGRTWTNEREQSGHANGLAEGFALSHGHGAEPQNYDPAWPHQENAPALPAGPAAAPKARRRKSADRVSAKQSGDRASAVQLGESIPRKMRAHVASAVNVALTKAEFLALLEGLQDEAGQRSGEAGCLSVKLRAPDGRFMIDSVSPETQWADVEAGFGTSDSVSWRWMVTPLNPGHRRLQLVVSARTRPAKGAAIVTALPEQIINVRVGSNYGRGLATLVGWIAIAVVGWIIAKFGSGVLEPGMAELMKALK
jgi:neural Wiskott-Aldrich syndrome protein